MLSIFYLAFGLWAAGYLIDWRNKEPDPGTISDWLMLVTISLVLGPITMARVSYFTGMMDKQGWTLYLNKEV